ncbi:response regulator transcription factor [Cysteiniphilum sp. JM-1]|uniref:response regulator transcription factor n=1 Tax=Cysteiniphilum sp. JM-1 TaxID=2610891 RepID=UPI001244F331|nr:response regulator transcription factor [Cysteiniphilum sp. JM-1]
MSKLILIVDDDKEICSYIEQILRTEGYFVRVAYNATEAEILIESDKPDLVLLDIMMPGESGIDFCRRIYDLYQMPIMMLTASSELVDEVLAYEFGADNYLSKPFNRKLLLAKIKHMLRRFSNTKDKSVRYFIFEDCALDLYEKTLISKEGVVKDLSLSEYKILLALIKSQGKILTRDDLIRHIYHRDFDGYNRAIDVSISRLRRKLGGDARKNKFIKTISGFGYLFLPAVLAKKTLIFDNELSSECE